MLDQVKSLWNFTLATSPGGQSITVGEIVLVLALLVVGYYGSRLLAYLLGRRMNKASMQADVVHVIKRVIFIVFLVVIALTALSLLGIPLTAFAFATGAIAIGVGFGAQNIINNFISGWILMWERPIKIGDFLELADVRGTVEAINTRSTRIRRVDGVHLLVPNSFLLENTITNWTLVDRRVRTSVVVGVAYGSDVKLVRRLLEQAAREHPEILTDPPFQVFFDDFADSALVFEVLFWILASAERGLRTVRSDLRYRIDELFAEHDVVISFPQRDVHLDGSLKIVKGSDEAGIYSDA